MKSIISEEMFQKMYSYKRKKLAFYVPLSKYETEKNEKTSFSVCNVIVRIDTSFIFNSLMLQQLLRLIDEQIEDFAL